MPPHTFERLVDDHHAVLFRFASQLAATPEAAADLTRRAFLRWLHHPAPLSAPRPVRLGLLRELYQEYLRAHLATSHPSPTPAHPPGLLPRLELPLRASLALFYLENLGVGEIAELLDLPQSDVHARLDAGKTRLHEILAAAGPYPLPAPPASPANAIV